MSLPSLRRRRALAALLVLAPTTVGVALAEGTGTVVRGLGGVEASPLATLLRLAAALCLVLLVFWGCARLVRRVHGAGFGGATAQAGLRVVGALSLGNRERLVIVQAGEEQLLLGVTATRIDRLHLLSAPLVAPDGKPDRKSAGGPDGGDFRARLLAAMNRRVPS